MEESVPPAENRLKTKRLFVGTAARRSRVRRWLFLLCARQESEGAVVVADMPTLMCAVRPFQPSLVRDRKSGRAQ
jgi:hypothetical protein